MACTAFIAENGAARRVPAEEATSYAGPGFVWLHIENGGEADFGLVRREGDIPDIAANALVATETRPRCDRIEDGALVNLRGPAAGQADSGDRLVSIRLWVRGNKADSVSRRPLAATAKVIELMEAGKIHDAGDLVAAFAWAISTALDPDVAALGDALDDCESDLEPRLVYKMRSIIARVRSEAINYRRFVAPDRDALSTLANLDFDWLASDDRLHIREAADRFARMAEELEAVRERSALLHEQLTDLRGEQMEFRALIISIVALIFLPLTFVTGLLGMNVRGIPYATEPWAFWGVVAFCAAIALLISAYFAKVHWFRS